MTAPACPLSEPIFFDVGVDPGACVYFTTLPDGNGPNVTPPVTTVTARPSDDPIL